MSRQPQPPEPSRRPSRRAARTAAPGRDRRTPTAVWLYGLHAVLACVANPERRCRRLLATDRTRERLAGAAAAAAVARPDVELCDRRALAAVLPPDAVHQGFAALVEPLAELTLEEVVAGLEGAATASVVVLDQASDPRNVGAVIRSAAAFGAAAVVTQDRHAPTTTGALAKAAAGGLERVSLVSVVNLARALRSLQAAGFWCIGLDAEAQESLARALPPGRAALVLGSEGYGLRRLTRETCDGLARIPIASASGSLNLSAAAAIALYERARGEDGAG
ncbi:MAG: 23S rRNA (guanosine(2251)-2'-O)-methyltransferase RlmB [Rhodospirillales bacterium]|nr:23S rRNA (guanosine(2251)-2'-O)-methyltransferase RlmB [Rhodospirillales bacterium]